MTKHVPSPILRNLSKTGKRKAGNEQVHLREKELNNGECQPTWTFRVLLRMRRWRFCGKTLFQFSSVQLFSRVWLFETPWTAACQASLSTTKSRSILKFMSIELVMPSNHLILCRPLLLLSSIFSSIRVFSNESVLRIRWPKDWSFSFSISPSSEYSGLISLGWTGWISFKSKGLSRVFSNTTVQKDQFFGVQLSSQSNSHIHTWPLEKP